jgi:sec-independent protein translocase protein TatC
MATDTDSVDLLDRARASVQERAELPGMSLMDHLQELRKRLVHAILYLLGGCAIAGIFIHRLTEFIQKPLTNIGLQMTMFHPTDAINFDIKTALVFGAIIASQFILYQVWLFISPGMYANEKKYVWPFMTATVGLFLAGAWFGYRWVLPGTMVVLVKHFGEHFNQVIGIDEYTGFFMSLILGLGITFELPILIFFLSLFGIVDAKFLLKHFRYAIMAIFLVAAVICPDPSPTGMCLFASPMLVLYFLGVIIAYYVHPNRRNRKKEASGGVAA